MKWSSSNAQPLGSLQSSCGGRHIDLVRSVYLRRTELCLVRASSSDFQRPSWLIRAFVLFLMSSSNAQPLGSLLSSCGGRHIDLVRSVYLRRTELCLVRASSSDFQRPSWLIRAFVLFLMSSSNAQPLGSLQSSCGGNTLI